MRENIRVSPIGSFSSLETDLVTRFAWGKEVINYSFVKELGFPNIYSIRRVKSRVDKFVVGLGIDVNIPRVIVQSPVGCDEIIEVDNLDNVEKTNQGLLVEAAAVFTTNKDILLYAPIGDCRWGVISAVCKNGKKIVGLIHSSRAHLDRRSIDGAVDYLVKKHECNPTQIKVGITPGLSKKHHVLEYDGLQNRNGWGANVSENGKIHVDTLGYAIQQYQDNGIVEIETYPDSICTYESAINGESFISYRFAKDVNKPELDRRTILAAKIID